MRWTSIVFMVAGLVFMAIIYFMSRTAFLSWYLVYYITMGFLACMALFYKVSRWGFFWGVTLGFMILAGLVKYGYLTKGNSFLPF